MYQYSWKRVLASSSSCQLSSDVVATGTGIYIYIYTYILCKGQPGKRGLYTAETPARYLSEKSNREEGGATARPARKGQLRPQALAEYSLKVALKSIGRGNGKAGEVCAVEAQICRRLPAAHSHVQHLDRLQGNARVVAAPKGVQIIPRRRRTMEHPPLPHARNPPPPPLARIEALNVSQHPRVFPRRIAVRPEAPVPFCNGFNGPATEGVDAVLRGSECMPVPRLQH